MTFTLAIKTAQDLAAEAAEQAAGAVVTAIDAHVEEVARARGYNSAATLSGYATSTVPSWAAEAQAFVAWRDAVWTMVHAVQADVQAGNAPMPTPAEAVAALPAIQWPV
ncbi:MAG: hypothetical protein AB7S99_00640 [Pseudodonghicola sp.]